MCYRIDICLFWVTMSFLFAIDQSLDSWLTCPSTSGTDLALTQLPRDYTGLVDRRYSWNYQNLIPTFTPIWFPKSLQPSAFVLLLAVVLLYYIESVNIILISFVDGPPRIYCVVITWLWLSLWRVGKTKPTLRLAESSPRSTILQPASVFAITY